MRSERGSESPRSLIRAAARGCQAKGSGGLRDGASVSRETAHRELQRIRAEFDKTHRYLLKILSAATRSATGTYHGVEHLLMRLQYNSPDE